MCKKNSNSDKESSLICVHAPKMARSLFALFLFILTSGTALCTQEVLKSDREEYYNFLFLEGVAIRGFLNYRTLSDSIYVMGDERLSHPWQGNLGDATIALNDSTSLRIYGPSVYSSYNSASPYGQNDGVLWQGKGFNAHASAGLRLESHGFELTFKPDVAFSQNLAFEFMTPAYAGKALYAGKAATYGYYGVAFIDAPQRFGNSAFFDWSWGDSEVRYTWNGVTLGFGTQNIWLGPARLNPIIHSNNATPYPKFDLGLRPTSVYMPHYGWYVGDVEVRFWAGYLSESDYFDTDASNDAFKISGLSLSYAPSFTPGLSLGFHRIMLYNGKDIDLLTFPILLVPKLNFGYGDDEADQRASVTVDYTIQKAGMNVYLEWAKNDFSSLDTFIRYPWHTVAYTLGLAKSLAIPQKESRLKGLITIEITQLESFRDNEFMWPVTFYAHDIVRKGHTNRGQWLGAGIGTGGNAQSIKIELFPTWGLLSLELNRENVNNDYVWYKTPRIKVTEDRPNSNFYNFKVIYNVTAKSVFFINPNMMLTTSFGLADILNPLHKTKEENFNKSVHLLNIHSSIAFQYNF